MKKSIVIVGIIAACISFGAIAVYLHRAYRVADIITDEARYDDMNESITVNLYYTGEGDNARLFMEEMESSGTADLIRAEEGNLRYEYFLSAADPHTVLLIDSWDSQVALDRHHQTPMMQTIAALREKYDLHMRVERYLRSDETPVTDQKYIRE